MLKWKVTALFAGRYSIIEWDGQWRVIYLPTGETVACKKSIIGAQEFCEEHSINKARKEAVDGNKQ